MNKPARENASSKPEQTQASKTPADIIEGTHIMPMPDDAPEVAGRPRKGRVITAPGEPGVITPEDDVLDTSQQNRQGR